MPTQQEIEAQRAATEAHFAALPPQRPDATMLQVTVWLAREPRNISPAQLEALIMTALSGAARTEALARLQYAWRVPFDNALTQMLAGALGVSLADVWEEILAIET